MIDDTLAPWRDKFYRRRAAYRALFLHSTPAPKSWAFWRRPSGGTVAPAAHVVLDDLRRFCHVERSTARVSKDGRIDSHAMAIAEGRREVWCWIQYQLNLTDNVIQLSAQQRSIDE